MSSSNDPWKDFDYDSSLDPSFQQSNSQQEEITQEIISPEDLIKRVTAFVKRDEELKEQDKPNEKILEGHVNSGRGLIRKILSAKEDVQQQFFTDLKAKNEDYDKFKAFASEMRGLTEEEKSKINGLLNPKGQDITKTKSKKETRWDKAVKVAKSIGARLKPSKGKQKDNLSKAQKLGLEKNNEIGMITNPLRKDSDAKSRGDSLSSDRTISK